MQNLINFRKKKFLKLKLYLLKPIPPTMFPDTYLFSICMILIGLVLFLLIYFVLILSDVECDYINAQQCCTKLNIWMIPKVATHGVVTILLLLTGHWMLFLCNVPFLSYLIWELWKVPRGKFSSL